MRFTSLDLPDVLAAQTATARLLDMRHSMLSIVGGGSLDWAIISRSLLNMIGLLWLGLPVLLNAERQTVGP